MKRNTGRGEVVMVVMMKVEAIGKNDGDDDDGGCSDGFKNGSSSNDSGDASTSKHTSSICI